MAYQLLPKDLPNLLAVLKKQFPDSIFVYTPISLITQGLDGYIVFVDRWPEYSAVLVKPDMEAINNPDHEKSTFVYLLPDTDEAILRDLIGESGILRQQSIFFAGATIRTSAMIKDFLCASTEPEFVEQLSDRAQIFSCTTVSHLPELPKGYSARSLRYEDHDTVLTGVWYKDLDYAKSVRRILALGSPSVGVENSNGQLVAWSLQHVMGLLGMTYVIPEHRNRKLGKYVTAALAQKMIAKDGICLAGIKEWNSASVELHEKIGFVKLDISFSFSMFHEKGYAARMNQNEKSTSYK